MGQGLSMPKDCNCIIVVTCLARESPMKAMVNDEQHRGS